MMQLEPLCFETTTTKYDRVNLLCDEDDQNLIPREAKSDGQIVTRHGILQTRQRQNHNRVKKTCKIILRMHCIKLRQFYINLVESPLLLYLQLFAVISFVQNSLLTQDASIILP